MCCLFLYFSFFSSLSSPYIHLVLIFFYLPLLSFFYQFFTFFYFPSLPLLSYSRYLRTFIHLFILFTEPLLSSISGTPYLSISVLLTFFAALLLLFFLTWSPLSYVWCTLYLFTLFDLQHLFTFSTFHLPPLLSNSNIHSTIH